MAPADELVGRMSADPSAGSAGGVSDEELQVPRRLAHLRRALRYQRPRRYGRT
jgi:hypothetical protein